MLLEGAIGDSFASGFKWCDERFVRKHLFSNFYIQNQKFRIILGNYNDQMPMAIAELILERPRWTRKIIADKFCLVHKRDPRNGSRFNELLADVENGKELLQRIIPNSEKSGAAMRSPPLGFVSSIEKALKYAELHASITHATKIGIDSAKAVATMSFFRKERKNLPSLLNKYVPQAFNWNETWDGPVSNNGIMSVHAALVSLLNHDNLTDILRACISYTGDVEAVASIALSIGSECCEIKQNLPQELIDGLENNTYGKDYLNSIDLKLR